MLFETNIKDLLRLLPSNKLRLAKNKMRELLVQKRRVMPTSERQMYSQQILDQLEQMTCFREAKTVLLYYPIQNEVDVLP